MPEENKQITKKQHFVPKFYLKKFADENDELEVLDIKNRRLGNKKHYGSICYDSYFYGVYTGKPDEVSQAIEDYFQHVENKAAPFMKQFAQDILDHKQLKDVDLFDMAYIVSMLWIRSNYFRENMNRMESDMLKQMNELRALDKEHFTGHMKQVAIDKKIDISDEEIEKMRQVYISGEYDFTFSNVSHLRFFGEIDKFANMFFGKHWRIYIAKGSYKFITSDTPVAEWAPERKTFYGSSFLSRKQYFPLTPDILIEFIYPISGKKVRRNDIMDEQVLKLNALRIERSLGYCYAADKEQFQLMLDFADANDPTKEAIRLAKI